MVGFIGIDFGTSNSTVGYIKDGQPYLLPLEQGKADMPSAIFYDTEKKETLLGRAAISAYIDHCEGRLLRALKSILGTSLVEDVTQIGKSRIPFQKIIADYLRHLKVSSETYLGREVDHVLLGRPVHFVDDNPEADARAQGQLEKIAQSCGFKDIQFQFEPIAAALDYERTVQKEEIALIADIGGGTSDFSVIRISPEHHGRQDRQSDILSNAGVHIGGTDYDRRLSLTQVMPFLGLGSGRTDKDGLELPVALFSDLATWHKIALLYTHKYLTELKRLRLVSSSPILMDRMINVIHDQNGHRLAGDVESAKIALSDLALYSLALPYVEADLEVEMQAVRFQQDAVLETNKIVNCMKDCIKDAGLKSSDIHTLFMTGGTTSIPFVQEACRQAVPQAAVMHGDRFGSVGLGLAIDAASRWAPLY